MRILILGGDGYLGWPTAMRFSNRGHEVHVVDNYLRRTAHREAGTDSLTPIPPGLPERVAAWKDVTGLEIGFTEGDLCRVGDHRGALPRLPSGRRRALRRDAVRPLLDEGPGARGLHPDRTT